MIYFFRTGNTRLGRGGDLNSGSFESEADALAWLTKAVENGTLPIDQDVWCHLCVADENYRDVHVIRKATAKATWAFKWNET